MLGTHNGGFLQPPTLSRRGELPFAAFRAINPACLVADLTWHTSKPNPQTMKTCLSTPECAQMEYLDYGQMAIRDDQGRIQPIINMPPWFHGVHSIPLFTSDRRKYCLPADEMARDVAAHLNHLIQPERLLGAYVVPSLERAVKDKLDGASVDMGGFVSEKQPEMVLSQVLRNYGALWGGMIASDRLDRLQGGETAFYIMPSGAGDTEAKPMADFVRRGGGLSVFFSTGGTKKDETALSTLFGVKYAPIGEDVQGMMQLGPNGPKRPYPASVFGAPQYVSTGQVPANDLVEGQGAVEGRVLLRTVEAGKGRAVFSSMNADLRWGWDHDLARRLAQAINWTAGNPVTLPEGVGGYAFEAKGMTFLVLEDLKYTGGVAEIHVRLPAGNYLAADLFSGQSVQVESSPDGVIIRPTLLPNGWNLVVVRKAEQ